MEKTFVLKDPEATRAFGKELAARLAPGTVIALTGDLGAGKRYRSKTAVFVFYANKMHGFSKRFPEN